jgi:hypothetical protein
MLKRFMLLAMLSAWPAVANTIIVSGTDAALGKDVYIYDNGVNQSVWAGGIDIKVNGYTRLAFCIELLVDINIATYNTTLDLADTSSNVQRVAWLLTNQYPTTAGRWRRFPTRCLGHHDRQRRWIYQRPGETDHQRHRY